MSHPTFPISHILIFSPTHPFLPYVAPHFSHISHFNLFAQPPISPICRPPTFPISPILIVAPPSTTYWRRSCRRTCCATRPPLTTIPSSASSYCYRSCGCATTHATRTLFSSGRHVVTRWGERRRSVCTCCGRCAVLERERQVEPCPSPIFLSINAMWHTSLLLCIFT